MCHPMTHDFGPFGRRSIRDSLYLPLRLVHVTMCEGGPFRVRDFRTLGVLEAVSMGELKGLKAGAMWRNLGSFKSFVIRDSEGHACKK
jgi:hypothetical protein